MLDRLVRSWSIFTHALSLMRLHPKLLIFPVISFVAMAALVLLILGSLLGALWASGEFDDVAAPAAVTAAPASGDFAAANETVADGVEATAAAMPATVSPDFSVDYSAAGHDEELSPAYYFVYFLCYLLAMLVANFCSAAFYHEIIQGLDGAAVSITRGFGYALSRFKAIFFWSLLASTVGVLLSMFEERLGWFGQMLVKLVGVVWAVASVFAIPALVCDDTLQSPIEALKRSASTIRKTWGESLIGFVGIQILSGALAIVFVLFAVVAFMIAASMGEAAMGVAVGAVVLALLATMIVGYLIGVAQKIYIAALYLYANGRPPAHGFNRAEYEVAFKRKAYGS